MKKLLLTLTVMLGLVTAAPAGASVNNAIQPANLYFGEVQSGTHPVGTVTVTNKTGRNQYIRAIGLEGALGGKFTYTWRVATCYVGLNLRDGESCTLQVRVLATIPEFYQTDITLNYGPRIKARAARGNWNGGVYAHVV